MTRRVENAVILDGPAAAMLTHAAGLDALRIKARGKHERLYALLMDIKMVDLAYRSATSGDGKRPAPKAEATENINTTFESVEEISNRTKVSTRTVRNDIARGLLQATKYGNRWLIRAEDAEQYIAGRKPA